MSSHLFASRRVFTGKRTPQRTAYFLSVVCLILSLVLPVNVMAASAALPTQATAAAAEASCSISLLATGVDAATAEAIVVPAAADAPMNIPKTVVDRAIFYANWRTHHTDAEAVESLLLTLFLMAGATSPADALTQLQQKFHQRIPADQLNDRVHHPYGEIVYQYMDAALSMPALAPYTPYVWEAINAENALDELPVDTPLQIAQSASRYDLGLRLLSHAQEYMGAAHTCARQNSAFAARFNDQNASGLGASIGDSATTIIANNADLKLPTPLTQGIQPDGSAVLSFAQLQGMGDAALSGLGGTFDDLLDTIKNIDLGQNSIVDWFKDLLGMNEDKDTAKQKAEETEKKLKEYEQAIAALTTIFTQIDPQFAKGFKTVASSYLDVVKSINSWMQATAGLGSLDKIFSLSTVIMTGNILGAVMNVVSLFGDGKPSPEQKILEEIGKLRKQVNQLRQEMHNRFDRIDAQLNMIFTTMNERFDQIDVQLGIINGNIRDVQRSLIDLDLRLSQVERNNFELLNVLGRRPLLDAINAGLDYQRVTGSPMPFQPEFVGFERTFHTWGTVHAFDPLNTGPSQRDYGDGDLLRELTTYPLDANLNYLNGWLVAHGRPALASGMLPSPRDWLLASRAYTQLGLEWPAHMARIDAGELAELEAVGGQLEDAIGKITLRNAPSASLPEDSIFADVAARYAAKFVSLDAGLLAIENTLLDELKPTFDDPNVPFNLYGGPDQVLVKSQGSSEVWIPVGYTKVLLPDDEQPWIDHELAVPANVAADITQQIHLLFGIFLKLGGAQPRITMTLSETNYDELPCNPPLKPKDCAATADVTVKIDLYYGNTIWRTWSHTFLDAFRTQVESLTDSVLRKWNATDKDVFGANAVIVPPTPDQQQIIDSVRANAKGGIASRLQQYQQNLYARMVDQMSSGTLHPLMVEISGLKALLDAFTSLGLPRALANDEFLHASLFGDQRVYDAPLVINTFAISATQPITGPSLLINQRPLLKTTADDRLALYMQLVNGYLDAIAAGDLAVAAGGEATNVHEEAADYLVGARQALNLSVRIARIPRPTTPEQPGNPTQPGAIKVFLPAVGK